MHIDIVPNRNSPPAVLLRESYREGKKVKKRTLANLSSLSPEQIDAIRRTLRGERLAPVSELFEIVGSKLHGHVDAVHRAIRRLRLDSVIAAQRSPERDRVIALLIARIVEPASKLATSRWWHSTTIPELCGVADTSEDELYAALDWLIERQPAIERKLAKRHLEEGAAVFFDLSSSYFEGSHCPLAAYGYNRDGKRGKLQVNYGLLTDRAGRPVAVSVFEGNTSDPTTLLPQIDTVQERFAIERFIIVGDRGMLRTKQIAALREKEGLNWISALDSKAIRKIGREHLQLGLFDERNLFEVIHPDYPGERLIACRNAELAKLRAHKRNELLESTCGRLAKIAEQVERGMLRGRDQIGIRVGKDINRYKVAKHLRCTIEDDRLVFSVDEQSVADEAWLDGIYVIRTNLPSETLGTEDVVRGYKNLSQVERAFRSIKTAHLQIRPIHHRLEQRVRAHIFLAMLAYYVRWHMLEAWRPILFADEDQEAKLSRDPVAPAQRSAGALQKIASKRTEDGAPAHSFRTLLLELSSIVLNRCRRPEAAPDEPTFDLTTTASPTQQRAIDLLATIAV
jgi:hypothetical protein